MTAHIFEIHREKRWPGQWIGQCRSCRCGIRCNSKRDAEEFRRDHLAKTRASGASA